MGNVARTVAAVAVGVLVGGVLVGGALAWRLERGPIGLDFLTPRLEQALAPADGSATVEIGSTALEWDRADHGLDVRARDVRVVGPGGSLRASVPALAVGIAPAPLLVGSVVPRTLEAIAPTIRVVRDVDGRVAAGIGGGPAGGAADLFGAALPAPGSGGATEGTLLRVRDGSLVLEDRATGTSWRATSLAGTARRTKGGLAIERLTFDVAPATVTVTGQVRGGAADLDVVVDGLPTRLLAQWWPATAAPALRDWVLRHVSGGLVTAARARVTGTVTGGPPAPRLALDVGAARIVFGGLEVDWLADMPPLRNLGGIAEMARGGWQIRLARGEVEGLDLVRATVTPGASELADIRFDALVRAPLSKVLTLVGRPQLRAAANVPFRPGEISGGMSAHVLMDVPRSGGRPKLRATGELRSVSLRRAFRNRNVNARRMRFMLSPAAFHMRGAVTVGRAPLALRWRQRLGEGARGDRRIDIKARLDADERRALGFDLGDWVQGPIDLRARLAPKGPATTGMTVRVDLGPASIDLPLVNIVKDAGAPGFADARLVVANGYLSAVDEFRLRAAGSAIDGRALLGPRETWRSGEATFIMAPRSQGSLPTRAVATLAAGAGSGTQLTVSADDAGAVVQAVDAYADATGGRLRLTGEIRFGVPGMPFTGTLEADRFVVRRSPMIAKIAAMGPVPSVVDLLTAGGLPFSQLVASFNQRAGVITVPEAVAAGPGLALTLRGSIDRPADDLSLEGSLVPNHEGLERLLQDSPTVTALGGERITALDFSVSGSLADPYVSANPSSSMSPSTVRDLLRLTTGSRMRSERAGRRERDDGAIEEEAQGRRRGRGRRRSDTDVVDDVPPKARSKTKRPAKAGNPAAAAERAPRGATKAPARSGGSGAARTGGRATAPAPD